MPLTRVTWTMLVPAVYTQAYPVWPWLVSALLVCTARPEMPRLEETADACGQPAAVPPDVPEPEPDVLAGEALPAEVLLPAAAADEDEDDGPHPVSRPTTTIPIRADVVIRMFNEDKAAIQQVGTTSQFIYIMFDSMP